MSEHCTCGTSDYCQVHDQIESLRAQLAEATAAWHDRDTRLLAAEARLAKAEAALSLASQAIDERLSGLSGDPLQPVADEINRYFAPDSASVEGEK